MMMATVLLRRAAWQASCCRSPSSSTFVQSGIRSLSSTDAATKDETTDSKKQSFVTSDIEPQVFDHAKTDPLHRPKYRSRARIISKYDYAKQPSVTFEDQYDNFADARVVMSWMDHNTKQRLYENYLNWMVNAQEKFGKTSHEYVCRVLAQKFRITPHRAAAIIQLQHNEEQRKIQNPDLPLCEEEAQRMDEMIKYTIQQAYQSTGETPPETFLEAPDPEGGMESYKTMIAEDLMDVDQLIRDANVREQEQARIIINDHVYVEDVDEHTIGIRVSKETNRILAQQEKLKQQAAPEPLPSPTASVGEARPRWQYVAQLVDTRELHPRSLKNRNKSWMKHKKAPQKPYGKKHRMGFLNNHTDNVVIEHNGDLRVANMEEVKKMPWKPLRNDQEFTYAGVKKAWLDRTIRGKTSAWGKKAFDPKEEEITKKEAAASQDAEVEDMDDEKEVSADELDAEEEKEPQEEEAKETDDKNDDNK
ncbi:expressed unknown protein [Seminavis robusta]|uniref:Uncharacterized protein n=1 Tax=Seminavis robusta TaxID=568900 RepID=A0A9N8H5C5_9STRA|nr:expressed unknown protein [Seminavis robusta]|eukprot:Sro83_g044200.1 n/a (476) ;mRNA; r:17169-18596